VNIKGEYTMSSEIKFENLYAHNRQYLHQVVPLDTPFSVNIEPSSYCNIKCVYCVHSSREGLAALSYSGNYSGGFMSEDTFRLLVDQLCEFPQRIKSITFGGVGEPLLHPNLPWMIARIKEKNITDRINLITNGIPLSESKAADIIEAGLTNMKISLQGINAQAYYDTCGCRIDFDHFLENIDFLYKHRRDCEIGIKIADISLYRGKSETEKLQAEEQYRELFGEKCDKLGIEHIVPCFDTIDYSKLEGMSGHKSRYDITERRAKVCSQPFYRINIMQNGCVTLCTMLGLHEDWMNIHQRTLKEIWDSEVRKRKLVKILQDIQDEELALCKDCNVKYDFAYEEDNLDPYADEIILKIMEGLK